jgi:hypothetical protein
MKQEGVCFPLTKANTLLPTTATAGARFASAVFLCILAIVNDNVANASQAATG